ncbi:hypothetical protein B0H16DRAFT_1733092 [Mycena metata]|uniref:Uncharacterized protein n=1 Tax=Mycena metata TaxID=1033252 RepID=A0AAD7HZK6_9AGAR|nr:hypothetical protein B0H16DRAFT_1733092 [Mycena metata]
MLRTFILLLFMGFPHATLQRYTVDIDTSPDIQHDDYCVLCSCPLGKDGKSNQSFALTTGVLAFSLNGTGIYPIRTCVIILGLDGEGIQDHNLTAVQAIAGPTSNATLTGPDYLAYTPPDKINDGAIIGGVIGGVVIIVGALFGLTMGALYLALFTRRKLIMRRNRRNTAVLREITSARHDHRAGEEQPELPP